jgi:hypothetical protein
MKITSVVALAFALIGFSGVARADLAEDLQLQPGSKVLICGDSISQAHMYSHYLSAWLQLTYPALDLKVYELAHSGTALGGWAVSDTTPPAASEYERLAYPFTPDVVFLMLGQNGGQTALEIGRKIHTHEPCSISRV